MEEQRLDLLPSDVLRRLAFDLPYEDILRLCGTSRKFRRVICENDDFWRNLLRRDFNIDRFVNNPRQFYELNRQNMINNRNYCEYLNNLSSGDGFIKPYLEQLPAYMADINDLFVFNYIIGKIFNHGESIPDYFEATYDRYLLNINPIYGNRVHRGSELKREESDLLTEILIRVRDERRDAYNQHGQDVDNFIRAFLDGILRREIPYDVKLGDLCRYRLY